MHIEISEGIRSILIVDDEGIVAMMMEDLAHELGIHDVHVCADVASALEVLKTVDIDCAVLDIRLRSESSVAIADVLADRNIPFLFSTGSDATALVPRHIARPMINKPFSDDDFKLIVLDTWALARSASPIAALTMDGLRVARTGSTD